MRDYEGTAFELIEQLKNKQEQELVLAEQKITEQFLIKQSDSKTLVDMRKQEQIFFTVKDYDKAQTMRGLIEQQVMHETSIREQNLQIVLIKEMEKLRVK